MVDEVKHECNFFKPADRSVVTWLITGDGVEQELEGTINLMEGDVVDVIFSIYFHSDVVEAEAPIWRRGGWRFQLNEVRLKVEDMHVPRVVAVNH